MDEKIKLLAKSFGIEKVKFDEKIAPHTTLKLGGTVKLFTVAMSERELIKLVEQSKEFKIPFLVFGTGSKLIISDHGFNGIVIKNRTQNIKITSVKGKVAKGGIGVESILIEVDSGVTIDKLVEFIKKQGLNERNFEGITGSLGGNIFTNRSLQEAAESIKILNLIDEIEIITPQQLKLREHIVLSAVLKVKSKDEIHS